MEEIQGASGESNRIGDLHMALTPAPISDVIIDQHFAELGIHRLHPCAVTVKPAHSWHRNRLGTAVFLHGQCFRVVRSGSSLCL
jgi:cyanophycinase